MKGSLNTRPSLDTEKINGTMESGGKRAVILVAIIDNDVEKHLHAFHQFTGDGRAGRRTQTTGRTTSTAFDRRSRSNRLRH